MKVYKDGREVEMPEPPGTPEGRADLLKLYPWLDRIFDELGSAPVPSAPPVNEEAKEINDGIRGILDKVIHDLRSAPVPSAPPVYEEAPEIHGLGDPPPARAPLAPETARQVIAEFARRIDAQFLVDPRGDTLPELLADVDLPLSLAHTSRLTTNPPVIRIITIAPASARWVSACHAPFRKT